MWDSLADPLEAAGVKVVHGFRTEIDDFHVKRAEMYGLRKRQSESRFSGGLLERPLSSLRHGAARNTIAPSGREVSENAGA
jgi:hypothetical protein